MGKIEKYYENTKNAFAHKNVIEFLKIKNVPGKAIDLGCGTGRDTVFLIKNNWNVLSIDKENTKKIISDKLEPQELKRFRFISQSFENIELEKNNLVVANFSLPFCNKKYFDELWNKIVQSILEGRLFCRKFFWFKRFLGYYKKGNAIFIKRASFRVV